MASELLNWIQISLNLFGQSNTRIVWNLFLALVPLVLSFYLFRPLVTRNLAWWAILLIFIAFLPNAPYILTDTIHIIELSHQNYPASAVFLILIPQYILFVLGGFEAYVISLMRLNNYLIYLKKEQYLMSVNAIAHSLCAVGIYLGRFERFNSWDLVTQPDTVILTTLEDLMDVRRIFSIAIAFMLLWVLFEITKSANIKLFNRFRDHNSAQVIQ